MEIYDKNVLDFGFKPEITSVEDAEAIHERMIQIETKFALTHDPYAMPHYRGEQKYGWDLSPNLFRIKSLQNNIQDLRALEYKAWMEFESVIHNKFGQDALRTIFNNEKHGKDWDLVMQAQHAGIKTSLLDWSPTIHAPIYFATEKSRSFDIDNSDGQFWVYMPSSDQIKSHNDFPVKDTFYDQHPQQLESGVIINVATYLDDLSKRKYETRIFHQKGRFFVSGVNEWGEAMNKQINVIPKLFRFVVPAKYKESIRQELAQRKIDYNYLYGPWNPDHKKLMDDINERIYGA